MSVRTLLLALLLGCCALPLDAEDQTLCDAHNWFSPVPQAKEQANSLLCKGALDSSFERRKRAMAELQQVIAERPQSDQAFRAHELLTSLYERAGQYRKALEELDRGLQIRPTDKDMLEDRPLILALSREPDQTGKAKHARLADAAINDGNPHLPVRVNGHEAVWFMDTGANISVMSDAEAKALGLTISPVETTMGDISGSRTSLQVAMVRDLIIGRTHLKHVGFVVLSHTQPPFDDIPTDQQALVGIQVLRALGSIRIDRAGQVELGGRTTKGDASRMAFYDKFPVIEMASGGKNLTWTLDTGAQHTTLNQPFATAFPELVAGGKEKITNSRV